MTQPKVLRITRLRNYIHDYKIHCQKDDGYHQVEIVLWVGTPREAFKVTKDFTEVLQQLTKGE